MALLRLSQKITPQMILLSHVRQCFSRTSKRWAGRRPPHPLRRTESGRDLACLIRTSLRFSGKTTRAGPACRLHRRQPVARSQDLFSPLGQFQRRLAVVGSVAHLVTKDRGGLPRQRRSLQGPPAGRAGSRIPGALLAAAATGRCGCGFRDRPSGRSPPTSHTDIVVPSEVQPPQNGRRCFRSIFGEILRCSCSPTCRIGETDARPQSLVGHHIGRPRWVSRATIGT